MTETPQGLKPFIAKVATGHPLTAAEAADAFGIIMSGEATPAQMGGFLMALAVRGETVDEIAGAAGAMRAKMHRMTAPAGAIDVVGTGGDGRKTLNISTATAIVVAGCGVPVAKHGNRAASSQSGTADVQAALGVNLEADYDTVQKAIDSGLGFMIAPRYHSAMRHVMPTRVELGTRTVFNLLGPLCNPAGVTLYMLGVPALRWVEPVARVLNQLGVERAWVVHSSDGCDELTLVGDNDVAMLSGGEVVMAKVSGAEAGLPKRDADAIKGGSPAENAAALEALLAGHASGYRDTVLFNAAAALMVAGKAQDLTQGVGLAAAAIDGGKARAALDRLVAITNGKA